jgi:branched-chain amino acid transport system permease protein
MELLFQQAFNGLALGAVYALFALGFTLVFGVLGVLNLAHAAIFTWGSLVGLFAVTRLGLPILPALLVAMLIVGVVGIGLEYIALRPLRHRGTSELSPMISTLAVALILTSLAQTVTDTRVLRYPFGAMPVANFSLGPVVVTSIQAMMLATSLVLAVALYVFLRHTRAGRAVRAVAFSERIARLLGINADLVIAQTMFVSSALGAAAGVLIGLAFNAVAFNMGESFLLKGVTVIILGGFGSIPGALVGGLLLGLIETFSVAVGGGNYRDAIAFVLIVLLLSWRPKGLLGQGEGLRT